MMNRRRFFATMSAGLFAAPLTGEAQQVASVPHIGFLGTSSFSDARAARYVGAFRHGLRELGYVEGQNIAIEFRWAEGKYDRLPGLADELVRLKVNVLVAGSQAAIQAARHATDTIPIVMVAADPLATGFVASLAHPGGNITGLSMMLAELIGKQLELLREILPKVSRVALLGNPANPGNAQWVRDAQDAARALGLRLQPLEARGASEIDRAFLDMTREQAGALILLNDTMLSDHRTRIAKHAARHHLPTVSGQSEHADAGGLLAYEASRSDRWRRAATYVDKILKGAKAADLPVEQPTTLELVINLKTARALRVTIPEAVIQRADRVIH
jgi:putative tryptophan/tyrosine transport system substrate-binding protein